MISIVFSVYFRSESIGVGIDLAPHPQGCVSFKKPAYFQRDNLDKYPRIYVNNEKSVILDENDNFKLGPR